MFFNLRDPSFKQTNQPIKQETSLHFPLIFGSIALLGGIIVAAAGYKTFLPLSGTVCLIVIPYIIYLITAMACSELR
jgi:hypothetical protein